MKVWTCKELEVHWPVGVAAIVVADDQHEAFIMLNDELTRLGLSGDAEQADMVLMETDCPQVRILCDGNY